MLKDKIKLSEDSIELLYTDKLSVEKSIIFEESMFESKFIDIEIIDNGVNSTIPISVKQAKELVKYLNKQIEKAEK